MYFVLESTTKSLILPKITNPEANVKSPVAGMMRDDPGKNLICVYN